jgi:hypothetical protein
VKRDTRRTVAAVMLFSFLAGSPAVGAQNKAESPSPSAYDTAEETEDKIYDLSLWVLENLVDLHRPPNDTKEYMDKVVAILERRPPRPVTFDDYQLLATTNADATGKGEWVADVFLKLGLSGKQTSRTTIGGDAEISVYEWKNADGSRIVATFANRRLIAKTQSGLN